MSTKPSKSNWKMLMRDSPTLVCNLVFLFIWQRLWKSFLGLSRKTQQSWNFSCCFHWYFHNIFQSQTSVSAFWKIWLCCPLSVQWQLGWEEVEGQRSTKEGMDESCASPHCCWNLEFPSVFHFLPQPWKPQRNYKFLKALYNWRSYVRFEVILCLGWEYWREVM